MNRQFLQYFVRQNALVAALMLLTMSSLQAAVYVESFGFYGQHWDFKRSADMAKFNRHPIQYGYSFILYSKPEENKRVNAFVINNGEYLTVCSPNVEIILPLLRGMVKANVESNHAHRVILEAEVQKNLISTCQVSFTTDTEIKELFNRVAGYESETGLAINQ